jgi:hypothetical protein
VLLDGLCTCTWALIFFPAPLVLIESPRPKAIHMYLRPADFGLQRHRRSQTANSDPTQDAGRAGTGSQNSKPAVLVYRIFPI